MSTAGAGGVTSATSVDTQWAALDSAFDGLATISPNVGGSGVPATRPASLARSRRAGGSRSLDSSSAHRPDRRPEARGLAFVGIGPGGTRARARVDRRGSAPSRRLGHQRAEDEALVHFLARNSRPRPSGVDRLLGLAGSRQCCRRHAGYTNVVR